MGQLQLQFERTEHARLSRQQSAVLARLRRGRATNVELNEICFRYSARICELRKAGYRIEIVEWGKCGLRVYELQGD